MDVESKPKGKNRYVAPSWDDLSTVAAGQSGWFTTAQGHELGFSDQLLAKHVRGGTLARGQRGIYRIVRFPPGEHEDLVVAWLWSKQAGVISHQTALQLHGLANAFPARIHLTLPAFELRRGRTPPANLRLHFADIPPESRTWLGPIPVTTPARTVRDVAADAGDEHMVATAIDQGIREQRFGIAEVAPAAQYVAAFGPPWASRLSPASSEGIDIWNVGSFWGRSDHAAPADWTDIVTCIVENRGGAVRHRAYFPQERSYRVHVVWPERPPIDTLESVRSELAEALAWQR